MKRLYFDIDKENKVILDRKDFDYLMSIGHYNDKAIEYIEDICLDEDYNYCWDLCGNDIFKVLDILKGSDKK